MIHFIAREAPQKITTNKWLVYYVDSPIEYNRRSPPFNGQVVAINGVRVRCVGVEHSLILRPVRVGESIGICVADPDEAES